MALVKQGDSTIQERFEIYQKHIERLEEKIQTLEKALAHSKQTLAYYRIAADAGSEVSAHEIYKSI